MSDLASLKAKYSIYCSRFDILRFEVTSCNLNSKLTFILNARNEVHLNNCIWSDDNAFNGPDTCHCHRALNSPENYLESIMNKPWNFVVLTKTKFKDLSPRAFTTEEEDKDFYMYRMNDRENIHKWYELYKKQKNAYEFKIKVRELEKENEIDALFNSESGEWHLTDCIRVKDNDQGPHVCHCQVAMMNPSEYLKNTYNLIDMKSISKYINDKKTPVNYMKDDLTLDLFLT